MAKGVRYRKYSRRALSRARKSSKALTVLLVVAAFLLLCVIISVALGIALGRRAEIAEDKGTLDLSFEEYYSGSRQVRAVRAFGYSMDYDISNIWREKKDFSLCLREMDGSLGFDPDTAFLPAGDAIGKDKLSEHTEYILEYGGYISAYLYVGAFSGDDGYAAQMERAFEIALVNQAAKSGVGDVLLILPEINGENIDAVESYVSEVSKAAENTAVGVLLTPELLRLTENDVYYASRLRAVCDFAALDLRKADEENIEDILRETEYYIGSYRLRGVFNEENSAVADIAEKLGLSSFQIIKE